MFVVQLVPSIDPTWLALPSVRLGRIPADAATPALHATVEADGAPIFRCELYGSGEAESFAFQDAQIWRDWAVMGFGHALHFVGLRGQPAISVDLGCYFGHLYPGDDCLLVASCDHLSRFEPDGSMKWRSAQLGLDGVLVDVVHEGIVEGQGEWDPPGGWRPFRVSLATGAGS